MSWVALVQCSVIASLIANNNYCGHTGICTCPVMDYVDQIQSKSIHSTQDLTGIQSFGLMV